MRIEALGYSSKCCRACGVRPFCSLKNKRCQKVCATRGAYLESCGAADGLIE